MSGRSYPFEPSSRREPLGALSDRVLSLNHSEKLGEQLVLARRAFVVGRTGLANCWNFNGLVDGAR
jgi:hypothetical protein